jgi:hypothetical protein
VLLNPQTTTVSGMENSPQRNHEIEEKFCHPVYIITAAQRFFMTENESQTGLCRKSTTILLRPPPMV